MSNELSILALYGFLVLVTLVLHVLATMSQVGLSMLANPREDMPTLTGLAGRLERALKNSVVAMALFAPAVLILQANGGLTSNTLLAAQVFLVARLAYVAVYAAGTPWLRTVIWTFGFLATGYLYLVAL